METMNPEQQRIAIAKACGWTAQEDKDRFWRAVDASGDMTHELWMCERNVWFAGIPDYLNDLNAMHEAEGTLNKESGYHETGGYGLYLVALDHDVSATAAQRAKAFLKTLNLWKP
jgi:hypothetical protein